MVVTEQYVSGSVVGPRFAHIVKLSSSVIGKHEKDDDFVLIIAGSAGSGKSSLGLHAYTLSCDDPRVEQIALTKQDLASAFKRTSHQTGFRYVQYDEGKLNKREWNSEWSRDLMEMYHDIRGKNIYHVWCTAMPNLLDREFIDSRVKGFVFVYTKGKRFRRFLYFTKADILRFMDANDNKLSIKLLKRHGKSFARLDSYFVKYQGDLWIAYKQKKDERMDERIEEFYNKYGQGPLTSLPQYSADRAVDERTSKKWFAWGVEAKLLEEGRDYKKNGIGRVELTAKGQECMDFILLNHAGTHKRVGNGGFGADTLHIFNARRGENK